MDEMGTLSINFSLPKQQIDGNDSLKQMKGQLQNSKGN